MVVYNLPTFNNQIKLENKFVLYHIILLLKYYVRSLMFMLRLLNSGLLILLNYYTSARDVIIFVYSVLVFFNFFRSNGPLCKTPTQIIQNQNNIYTLKLIPLHSLRK